MRNTDISCCDCASCSSRVALTSLVERIISEAFCSASRLVRNWSINSQFLTMSTTEVIRKIMTTTVMISVNDGQKLSLLRLPLRRSMKSSFTVLFRQPEAAAQQTLYFFNVFVKVTHAVSVGAQHVIHVSAGFGKVDFDLPHFFRGFTQYVHQFAYFM
jgi:hypothetical protein